jgi:hypothetical protein
MMAITPQHLMHRLRANCHIYADDDYNHDRAQHRQKRRQVLVVVLAEVLRRKINRLKKIKFEDKNRLREVTSILCVAAPSLLFYTLERAALARSLTLNT